MSSSEKRGFRVSPVQAARIAVQILCFIFLPSLYIGALNGVRAIWDAVIHGSLSASLWPQLVEVAAVIPVTIIFGRFFCGWMCAFGAYTDFIYGIFHKAFPKKHRIPEQADAWMKKFKYLVLAVLVVAVWTLETTIFQSTSPWDVFGMIATVGKAPDFSYVFANLAVGFVLFVVISVLSAVYERFFCRYLCPMGAVFSGVSGARAARIKKPRTNCGSCRACTNACAMGIPLYKMDSVSCGECIDCMKCINVCPRGNAKLTVARSDVRPLFAGAAAAAMMTGFYYGGSFLSESSGNGTAAVTAVSTAVKKTYQDGTYTGTGTGFRNGTTKVSVTISNDRITDVSAVSTDDDSRFFNNAYQTISQEVLSNQSADVDAVSGATFSSQGILQAVADALQQAKDAAGTANAVNTQTTESSASSDTASSQTSSATVSEDSEGRISFDFLYSSTGSESSSSAQPASQASSQSAVSSESSESSESLEQSSESASSQQTESETSAGTFKDGVYTGTGTGFRNGTTTIQVTISGGAITDISAVSTDDDSRFFNNAYQTISQEVIANQSADVDAVSGATYSSQGIMQAVAEALTQAKQS